MQLTDLLNLLREEFSLDIPNAREAVQHWRAHPEDGAACAAQLKDFLERSLQASSTMGLTGFAAYLQLVHDAVTSAEQDTDDEYLQWLGGWIEPALLYLSEPASENAVLGIGEYLLACPTAIPEDMIDALAEMLSVPPSLPLDDEAEASMEPEQAMPEDVSLATDDVDPGLMSALLADAPDQLQRLASIIEALDQHGMAEPALLLEGQRIAHTFKGSGNIIGLPGIGRLSHRLEDVMEFALERAQHGMPVPRNAAQDMNAAVQTLQQMVAYLQGEDAFPDHALAVLQRMMDWKSAIAQGLADEIDFEPLGLAHAHVSFTAGDTVAGTSTSIQDSPASTVAQAADAPTLRVKVDSLNKLVRRAGQSIVQSQRMAQLLQNTAERLAELELTHKQLTDRLREFETTVGKQVVQLQERAAETGAMDPLEMDRYDTLYTLSRFIAESVQDESEITRQARGEVERAKTVLRDESYAQRNHHHELLDTRLVPVKTILPRLKRNVSQTASATGKQVRLQITGENITLDTDVLERLTEPLLHLLRNAVDHGIESAEEREVVGKEAQGLISLSFSRVGHEVEIVCADDGRGLDYVSIFNKAVEYGLVEPNAELSEDELRRLILRPGFSTKGEVTEISGRGVGMDVVNDRLTALKGRLEIGGEMFLGTTFTLRVPVSTGAVHALVLRCKGQTLAVSADQVQSISTDTISTAGNGMPVLRISDEEQLPYVELADWLGLDGDADDAAHAASRAIKPILVVHSANHKMAVGVDEVLESRELILQDVGRLIRRIPGLIGGSLRADGKPMMLLDFAQLERAARSAGSALGQARSAALRRRMQMQRTRVLVVDDALSVRRAMQQLLQDGGYEVVTAIDGFDALEKVQQTPPAIVLTDLEMPNLNGLDLTRRLRGTNAHAALPVIMITSRASDKHKSMALEAGVDEYLSKPYQDADLLAHIRRLTAKTAAKPSQDESLLEVAA